LAERQRGRKHLDKEGFHPKSRRPNLLTAK
jgi:hypothetical protein